MARRVADLPPLLRLEDDPLVTVVQHLPLASRLAAGALCRRLRGVVAAWPPISVDLAATAPPRAKGVLRWVQANVGRRLRALNLYGYTERDIDEVLSDVITACPQIEVLCVAHCPYFTDRGVSLIAERLHGSLRELCLWDAGRRRRRQALDMDSDDDDEESDSMAQLSGEALGNLFDRCTNLEAVDVRGQPEVNDDMLRRMAASMPRFAKFSLAGTSTSVTGFSDLLHARADTIVRAGGMTLRSGSATASVPAAPRLRELQISYAESPLTVDLKGLPRLTFIGVNGNQHHIDWSLLKDHTKVDQLWADGCEQPGAFFDALHDIAPRLRHLSLQSHRFLVHPPPSPLPCSLTGSIQRMRCLQQLTICPCSGPLLAAAAALPALRVFHASLMPRSAFAPLVQQAAVRRVARGGKDVVFPPGIEVQIHGLARAPELNGEVGISVRVEGDELQRHVVALPGAPGQQCRAVKVKAANLRLAHALPEEEDGAPAAEFPALDELTLTECEATPEVLAYAFADGCCPRLTRLHIARSMAAADEFHHLRHGILGTNRLPRIDQVEHLLRSLGARQLQVLSLPPVAVAPLAGESVLEALRNRGVGMPAGPRAEPAQLAALLGRVAPGLTELHVSAQLVSDRRHVAAVAAALPRLRVLGPRLGQREFDEAGHSVAWARAGGRRLLRRTEPHGYAEGSPVKPDCSFMRFMEFAVDPVYTTTRPDDGDPTEWPGGDSDEESMRSPRSSPEIIDCERAAASGADAGAESEDTNPDVGGDADGDTPMHTPTETGVPAQASEGAPPSVANSGNTALGSA